MKVKRFKSFRFKMVMYMFFSLIATFITEGLIFMGIYLYETEIIAGEYKKVWGASGQGKMSFGTFTMSQSIALDAWVIAIFTILLLIIYFILISNKFVTYVREIISGVERMKSGDLMEEIPVRGEDEFSEIAASINEMRHNLYETMEAQKAVEKTKDELITNVAHDLRTPLCSISGNADMLLGNSDRLDEATKHQIYSDIYDDSEWLIGVVENLLSITRLNDGRLKFKFTDQLLDEVIAESLRHISRKHDDYKIVTDCEELVLARMDVRLIMQVLVNLVDNAIKYTPPGSVIFIRGTKTDGKAQISVEDNGPGIPEEMKTHIFEMFYTGKTTVADSHRSLGLGLALCHSIIEAHEGTLVLTDHDPHGCNFTFTLPLSEVTLNE